MFTMLIINPGSTSTKIALWHDAEEIFSQTIIHTAQELKQLSGLADQFEYRKNLILDALLAHQIRLSDLSCIVARGGMLPPIHCGGYEVNDEMIDFLTNHPRMEHASNLGAIIAAAIARPLNIPAYIYDAVVADEMPEIAHITGFPEITRQSFCHVLNSRAMARKAALQSGRSYEESNYVVAHLGGGISISAHHKGHIIDSISDDAGPFSPERSGSTNLMYIVQMCYSGQFSKDEMLKKVRGNGGLKAYLGTHDLIEIEHMIDSGNTLAQRLVEAMGLQIAKGIGSMLCVFRENVDGIILTGGLAYSQRLITEITKTIPPYFPVIVLPGEKEMEALALGGLRIMSGQEKVHIFGKASYSGQINIS